MSTVILGAIALLAASGVVATVRALARDGYRRIPTRLVRD